MWCRDNFHICIRWVTMVVKNVPSDPEIDSLCSSARPVYSVAHYKSEQCAKFESQPLRQKQRTSIQCVLRVNCFRFHIWFETTIFKAFITCCIISGTPSESSSEYFARSWKLMTPSNGGDETTNQSVWVLHNMPFIHDGQSTIIITLWNCTGCVYVYRSVRFRRTTCSLTEAGACKKYTLSIYWGALITVLWLSSV